ncbi:uncharacterized protein [Branchiostoma lanceolatum]|uniref:uncharacterized protein n=1 Tax=Branchiostoma lanceolatum TaxID=7740 RepID=UPI003455D5F4
MKKDEPACHSLQFHERVVTDGSAVPGGVLAGVTDLCAGDVRTPRVLGGGGEEPHGGEQRQGRGHEVPHRLLTLLPGGGLQSGGSPTEAVQRGEDGHLLRRREPLGLGELVVQERAGEEGQLPHLPGLLVSGHLGEAARCQGRHPGVRQMRPAGLPPAAAAGVPGKQPHGGGDPGRLQTEPVRPVRHAGRGDRHALVQQVPVDTLMKVRHPGSKIRQK